MIATSLASISRPLWRLLERHSVSPEIIFEEARLDPAVMDQPRGRYKVEQVVAVWIKAADLIEDPCFGLKIAEVWSPTDLHALGYAFLASSTLRNALARLSRYVHVIDNVVGFTLDERDENISFTFTTENEIFLPPPPCEEDAMWAFITSLCRTSYGSNLDPVEVRFIHAEPACKAEYYGYFRCPVRFDSDESEILFARSQADRPLPAANRELARANDKILTEFLNNLRMDDLVTRVKTAIAKDLPSGSPSDELIAKAVYMTPRTLQRRLAAEGTSFSKLRDAVRRELAEQYIADPSQSLSEISYLLGFSELSAFSRAFRRWTGTSPTVYREDTDPDVG